MKLMKYFAVIIPLSLGVAAARWTSLELWFDMKEGLIAFLGFLAASIIQVMPLTTNFLQSDKLKPTEALRLTTSLTKQLRYWIGLLSATIAAMVIVIVSAALKTRIVSIPPLFWGVEFSAVFSFLVVTSVSFVFMKMLGLFEGLLSLHRLRGELVLNAAKRDATESIASKIKETEADRSLVPDDYGRIVHPH
jgi:hypothetical protein